MDWFISRLLAPALLSVGLSACSTLPGSTEPLAAVGEHAGAALDAAEAAAEEARLPPREFLKRYRHDALTRAVREGRGDRVEGLLQLGMSPKATDSEGKTALMVAVETGRLELAERLREAGANPHQRDRRGLSAVDRALDRRGDELSRTWAEARIAEAQAAFQGARQAIALGHSEALREALRREDFHRYSVGPHGGTLMQDAVHAACVACIGVLAEEGLDVNALDLEGRSALHIGAQGGDSGVIAALLAHGADTGLQDRQGWTPLMFAVLTRSDSQLEILLQAMSADQLSRQDNQGWTVLHHLVQRGDSMSPRETSRWLNRFVAAGAVVDAASLRGETPLFQAVMDGRGSLVAELLKQGADPGLANQDGVTPLMMAAYKSNLGVVRQLAAHPATLDRQDRNGWTALHYTVRNEAGRKDGVPVKIAEHLLDRGAQVALLDHWRVSPRWSAIADRQPQMAALLARYEARSVSPMGAVAQVGQIGQ